MTPELLDEAIAEAERFIARARKIEWNKTNPTYRYSTSKGSDIAAMKRASLDLSRALSRMRNGR